MPFSDQDEPSTPKRRRGKRASGEAGFDDFWSREGVGPRGRARRKGDGEDRPDDLSDLSDLGPRRGPSGPRGVADRSAGAPPLPQRGEARGRPPRARPRPPPTGPAVRRPVAPAPPGRSRPVGPAAGHRPGRPRGLTPAARPRVAPGPRHPPRPATTTAGAGRPPGGSAPPGRGTYEVPGHVTEPTQEVRYQDTAGPYWAARGPGLARGADAGEGPPTQANRNAPWAQPGPEGRRSSAGERTATFGAADYGGPRATGTAATATATTPTTTSTTTTTPTRTSPSAGAAPSPWACWRSWCWRRRWPAGSAGRGCRTRSTRPAPGRRRSWSRSPRAPAPRASARPWPTPASSPTPGCGTGTRSSTTSAPSRPAPTGMQLNSSFDEAIADLEEDPLPPNSRLVTVPEGFTVNQVIARLVDPDRGRARVHPRGPAGGAGRPDVRSAVLPADQASLEGTLFPETYSVEEGDTEAGVRAADGDAARRDDERARRRQPGRPAGRHALRGADRRVAGRGGGPVWTRTGPRSPGSSTTGWRRASRSASTPPRATRRARSPARSPSPTSTPTRRTTPATSGPAAHADRLARAGQHRGGAGPGRRPLALVRAGRAPTGTTPSPTATTSSCGSRTSASRRGLGCG